MSQDLSLARQLDTSWKEIFEEELKSPNIETVRGGLSKSLNIIEQQDTSIGRLKLTLGAAVVGILIMGGLLYESRKEAGGANHTNVINLKK